MLRFLLFTLLYISAADLYSQDSILIREYYHQPNATLKAEYWATADSTENGYYVDYYQSRRVKSRGYYHKGERVGKWYYFNDDYKNKLDIAYDWTHFKEVHSESLGVDSLKGIMDTVNMTRFPGGDRMLTIFLYDFMDRPDTWTKLESESGNRIMMIVTVSPGGQAKCEFKTRHHMPYPFKSTEAQSCLVELCSSMPAWIPSRGFNPPINTFMIPISIEEKQ